LMPLMRDILEDNWSRIRFHEGFWGGLDRQERITTKVYGGGATQIPEKVREDLGLRDEDYVVWINDHAGRWCVEKVRV